MRDCIRIEGIEFYAHHGVSAEEQKVGHRYWVDVSVHGNFRTAAKTDRLEDTVSYSDLARKIVQEASEQRFALLETLAEKLAEFIMNSDPRIEEVELTVGKLLPPTGVVVQKAAVIVRRSRADYGL